MTNVLAGRLGYVHPFWSLMGRFSADDRRRVLHDNVRELLVPHPTR